MQDLTLAPPLGASLSAQLSALRSAASVTPNRYSQCSPDFSAREWVRDFSPKYADCTYEEARQALGECDVLLVAASDVERAQAERKLRPLPEDNLPRRVIAGLDLYFIGTMGKAAVVLVQCEQGSVAPLGSEAVTAQGLALWEPGAVICVGAGFATSDTRCSPGDVMVSSWLFPYEHQKVTPTTVEPRAIPLVAGITLWRAFCTATAWVFPEPALSESVEAKYGVLLTGEKLVNSLKLRSELVSLCPVAIGGEMEGAGVAAAALRAGVEWIVVKGVMDWADGNKNDAYKQLAAASAVDLVNSVLSSEPAATWVRSLP